MKHNVKQRANSTFLFKPPKSAKRYHSANQTIQSPLKKIKPSPAPNSKHDIIELIEKEGDTYEELKIKNSKLRMLIIQASTKLNEMTKKCNQMENDFKIEKKTFLSELEKISNNYQMYAESYKQIPKIRNDYQILQVKYNQNNKVIENYQENIKSLLQDFIQLHSNISNYIENATNSNEYSNNHENNLGFIDFIKGIIFKNIEKYQKDIDLVNFGNFYNFYHDYLSKNEKENENEAINKKNVMQKKRVVSMRKKEYITLDHENDAKNQVNDNYSGGIKGEMNKYRFNKEIVKLNKRNNSFDYVSNNTNDV